MRRTPIHEWLSRFRPLIIFFPHLFWLIFFTDWLSTVVVIYLAWILEHLCIYIYIYIDLIYIYTLSSFQECVFIYGIAITDIASWHLPLPVPSLPQPPTPTPAVTWFNQVSRKFWFFWKHWSSWEESARQRQVIKDPFMQTKNSKTSYFLGLWIM